MIVQAYWGGITTLKYNFAHISFWVRKTLLVKNHDGFQANQVAKFFFGPLSDLGVAKKVRKSESS